MVAVVKGPALEIWSTYVGRSVLTYNKILSSVENGGNRFLRMVGVRISNRFYCAACRRSLSARNLDIAPIGLYKTERVCA